MRIVPTGFGGVILDFEWFLNYDDIKLVRQLPEIGSQQMCYLVANIEGISALCSLKFEVIAENKAIVDS